jgi:hypothetical protein|tara:strand:- start:566 stop:1003 length:438 start_codon:yes stop_codon:yes gene_type:complete
MAYITQEMKKELAPAIKSVLKKFGVKGTISINHNTSLNVNIKEGDVDFIGIYNAEAKALADRGNIRGYGKQICDGYYQENSYRVYEPYDRELTIVEKFINELQVAMRGTMYYNNDDIMTDYFDSAYFMGINIGKYNKPYKLTETS